MGSNHRLGIRIKGLRAKPLSYLDSQRGKEVSNLQCLSVIWSIGRVLQHHVFEYVRPTSPTFGLPILPTTDALCTLATPSPKEGPGLTPARLPISPLPHYVKEQSAELVGLEPTSIKQNCQTSIYDLKQP